MKSDRRVKYTKMVLRDALLEILQERPIERVSVKEICERADINRSTFYVHYGSPQELLDSIKLEMYDEIKAKKRDFTDIKGYMSQICEVAYEYRNLMRVLIKAGHAEMLFSLSDLWKDDFMKGMLQTGIPKDRLEVAFLYITCGAFAAIFTWALGGFSSTIDEIAEEVYKLTIGALNIYSEEE